MGHTHNTHQTHKYASLTRIYVKVAVDVIARRLKDRAEPYLLAVSWRASPLGAIVLVNRRRAPIDTFTPAFQPRRFGNGARNKHCGTRVSCLNKHSKSLVLIGSIPRYARRVVRLDRKEVIHDNNRIHRYAYCRLRCWFL